MTYLSPEMKSLQALVLSGLLAWAAPVASAQSASGGQAAKAAAGKKVDERKSNDSKPNTNSTEAKAADGKRGDAKVGSESAAGEPTKPDAAQQADGKTKEPSAEFSAPDSVDPLPALGEGEDDFKDLEKRAAENAKDASVESDDARVERELKEYKEQEAKEEAARARREAKAREEARMRARDEAAKEAKRNRETEKEAKQKAAGAAGITDDEMTWKGLED